MRLIYSANAAYPPLIIMLIIVMFHDANSEANYNKISPCERSINILSRSLSFETGGLINLATKS